MQTRIITSFRDHDQRQDRLRDALIGLSAATFAIGVLIVSMMMPAPSAGNDAVEGNDALQIVSGP